MFKKMKIFAMMTVIAVSAASLPMSAFASVPIGTFQPQVVTPLADGGIYVVSSRLTGKVWDVQDAAKWDGARIINWDCYYGQNQRWKAVRVENSSYIFVNVNSGKLLEVPGASKTWGVQLGQWTWNNNNTQKWDLLTTPFTDRYSVRNVNSGLVVDIAGSSDTNGAIIEQWGYTYRADNQYF